MPCTDQEKILKLRKVQQKYVPKITHLVSITKLMTKRLTKLNREMLKEAAAAVGDDHAAGHNTHADAVSDNEHAPAPPPMIDEQNQQHQHRVDEATGFVHIIRKITLE